MNWKRVVLALSTLALLATPARAGSFGAYGSHWDTDEADSSLGVGARLGFELVKILELEFRGTQYPDFKTDVALGDVDIKATPVDGGLRVNLLPSGPVNPYVGAGVTYYFLDPDQGDMDDETGWYAAAGLELGGDSGRFFVEALWRKLDTSISFGIFDADAQFDGLAINAGGVWRWGS
ncbi:MAG: outer membrane beta-barrel protein [Candidatus Polarisedimenticolia bacterium]